VEPVRQGHGRRRGSDAKLSRPALSGRVGRLEGGRLARRELGVEGSSNRKREEGLPSGKGWLKIESSRQRGGMGRAGFLAGD